MIRPPFRAAALAAALSVFALSAPAAEEPATPHLVVDVDQGRNSFVSVNCAILCAPSSGSAPTQLTPVGDLLFFVADDGVRGREVWVTDGTAPGTRPVDDDLCAEGCEQQFPPEPLILGTFGDLVVFRMTLTGEPQPTLFATDGSPGGTVELATLPDPCAFGACVEDETPVPAAGLGDAFYFAWPLQDGETPVLWRTDGTAAGTMPVDLGRPFGVRELAAGGGTLYVVGNDLAGDVTAGPDTLLRLDAGGAPADVAQACNFAGGIEGLSPHDGDLYFYAGCLEEAPGGAGTGLYRLDGDDGGVAELADRVRTWLGASTPSPFVFFGDGPPIAPPQPAGDFVYFVRRPESGDELWRTDGTAVEMVTALSFPVRQVLAAAGRPVLLTDESDELRGILDGELVPLGAGVLHRSLDVFTRPRQGGGGDLRFIAGDGTLWRTDGTPEGTALESAPPEEGAFPIAELALAGGRLFFSARHEHLGFELWAVEVEAGSAFGCVADDARLCLADGRFAVTVTWRDPRSGDEGAGHAVPETADSGFFWFFHPDNLEVLTKVLDAETVNGHHWVFHGSLTDVRYELRVEDLATGDVRTYERGAGSLCGDADTAAFPTGVGAATGGGAAAGAATPVSASLLLGANDRFTVAVEWLDPSTGSYVPATTVEKTADSGWAWFFDPANVEVFVKVLDGTPVNGRHWVFHGGLTDLGYRITVVDGLSGAQQVYEKAPGSLCGGADTAAF